MPKFNVTALRKAAEDAIKAEEADCDRRNKARAKRHEENRTLWLEQYGPAWTAAAKVITSKIRRGMPIRQADLPTGGGSYGDRVPYFTDSTPEHTEPRTEHLRTLVTILNTIIDDEVTDTALTRLGVTRATLSDALHYIGKHKVCISSC